jgi:4-amino-4-deoxy-L-arabinose transferase-like glycosyltransferase
MRRPLLHQLCLATVASTLFFTNLGAAKLWDRDEPRNAGCAAEMLQRGDWVVPVFNAELRPHKPVLLYWFMMSAYAVFGVTEFAARFWSAVLGVGTVLMTYHIGRRLFNGRAAFWGALVLSTCLMFDVLARAATPDSVFIFFATSAMVVYVFGTFAPSGETDEHPRPIYPKIANRYFPASWPLCALMYGMMGVAVLAKGPVGLVLPTAVIGMFLLVMRLPALGAALPTSPQPVRTSETLAQRRETLAQRQAPSSDQTCRPPAPSGERPGRWSRAALWLVRPFAPLHFLRTCWLMRPMTALAVVAVIGLPWYVLVSLRTSGDWVERFLLTHNVGRVLEPMEGHGGSILFYPATLVVGFFPWSVFLAPVLIGLVSRIRRRDPWHAGYILLACWVAVYIVLFSVARTKLPNYLVPAYPACALLTGCFIYHWTRGTAVARAIWSKLSFASLALVGVGLLVGLPLAASVYLPGEQWLGLVGLIPIAGAVACWMLVRRSRPVRAAAAFATTAVAFAVTLLCFVPVRVDRHQQSHLLGKVIAANSPQPRIASFGCMEPSWVYYAGRPIREIPRGRPAEARAFLAHSRNAFLITTDDRHRSLEPKLPHDVTVLVTVPFFLEKGNLVVLGRPRGVETMAGQPRPNGRMRR